MVHGEGQGVRAGEGSLRRSVFRGRRKERGSGRTEWGIKEEERGGGVFMHKNGHKFGPLFMRFIIFPRRFLFAAGNKCAGEFIFEIRVSFSRTPPPRPGMQGCYCALDIRQCLRGDTRRARRTKLYTVVSHPQ